MQLRLCNSPHSVLLSSLGYQLAHGGHYILHSPTASPPGLPHYFLDLSSIEDVTFRHFLSIAGIIINTFEINANLKIIVQPTSEFCRRWTWLEHGSNIIPEGSGMLPEHFQTLLGYFPWKNHFPQTNSFFLQKNSFCKS